MGTVKSQLSGSLQCSAYQAHGPTLRPPNCSLTPAKEAFIQNRTQQPLFPTPDPCLSQSPGSIRLTRYNSSTPRSLTASTEGDGMYQSSSPPRYGASANGTGSQFKSIRDARRRTAYIKAQAHYARDRKLQQSSSTGRDGHTTNFDAIVQQTSTLGPLGSDLSMVSPQPVLYKRSALVFDEELVAKADTPHLSEVTPGEDVSSRELEIDDGIDTLAEESRVMKRAVTSAPQENKCRIMLPDGVVKDFGTQDWTC